MDQGPRRPIWDVTLEDGKGGAYAEGPRALTRPSGPNNWPRPMFTARERGFGPEEADFSYSRPNPRFTARERGFAYYADGPVAEKADMGRRLVTLMGSGPWGAGRGWCCTLTQ